MERNDAVMQSYTQSYHKTDLRKKFSLFLRMLRDQRIILYIVDIKILSKIVKETLLAVFSSFLKNKMSASTRRIAILFLYAVRQRDNDGLVFQQFLREENK